MQTALALLLSPMGEDEFFRDYWERCRLYVKRDDPEHFAMLISASDLPQAIAAAVQAMRDEPPQAVPFLEIVARGEEPHAVAAVPTVAAVYAAFDSGSTVRLNHSHHYCRPMQSYVQRLHSELGFLP